MLGMYGKGVQVTQTIQDFISEHEDKLQELEKLFADTEKTGKIPAIRWGSMTEPVTLERVQNVLENKIWLQRQILATLREMADLTDAQ